MPGLPVETVNGADLILGLAIPGALVRAGRITCANEAAVNLLGHRFESDLVGRDFLEIVEDDAPHLIQARMRAGAAGLGAPRLIPALLKRAGAPAVAVDLSLTPIEEKDGSSIVALFPTSSWVDQRKEILSVLNERFRELIDAAAECVVVQDLQGRILLANRASQELLGRSEADLLGSSLLDFVPENEHAAVLERAATRLTGRVGTYSYEVTVIDAAEESIPMKVASTPLISDGKPLAVIFIARPADDRLSDAVRLRRERDAAREANRHKSELLARMSHEIRTPINVISGMIEMALDAELPPRARETIERARGTARGLRTLVDDILDLSRLEAGRLALAERPFSLRTVLGDTLDPLCFLAGKRGLEVLCIVDRDVPDALIGDASRLHQVVSNLVGNGIKFTPIGRVELRVSRAATPTRGTVHLLFAVRDTGLGIAREQRSRVFEPFWQADASGEDSTKGAGLGLAIVREIVSLMGGQVWVESEIGRGSVFYFTAAFTADAEAIAPAT